MRLLKPVAAVAAAAAVGSGVAVVAVHETSGTSSSTTIITRTVPAPSPVAATSSSGLTPAAIYERSVGGIVEITSTIPASGSGGSTDPFGGGGAETAQGTGFAIDDNGDIVTNAHVVAGASRISVRTSDGTTASATLVGSDPTTDVAVIKASSLHLKPLTLGDSSALRVGDPVVAIGDPFGYTDTLTTGVVSALHRTITSPNNHPINGAIQTDAAINHGNSGGPLLDGNGQVIGITSQIYAGSSQSGNVGIGFAVPSNTVHTIVNELLKTGKATHAFLGIYPQTVTGEISRATGMPEGVEVANVASGSPAARAGLHGATGQSTVGGAPVPTGGDVITAVNGQPMRSADALVSKILGLRAGSTISLTYVRAGHTTTVSVTLASLS